MIIYFADRDLNITGLASTNLPGGLRIVSDATTEDVDSGVNSFACTIGCNDSTLYDLKNRVKVGQFVIKNADEDARGTYDSVYQIMETEDNTDTLDMDIYAEDAGLDLLNKIVDGVTLTKKTLSQMMKHFIPADWKLNLISSPAGSKTKTWDGENTLTERINSVAWLWGCEVYYSFMIEGLEITRKIINVVDHRGTEAAAVQLRLGQEISRIRTSMSITELATAYAVTGGMPKGKDKPINLKNYTYSYTDPETGDVYKVDKPTGQIRNISAMKRWSSVLDKDGLIVKTFSFDTTNKAVLAGQARAELQKHCIPEVNYECDFVDLGGARIGDSVNIIDEDGELYLEARLLKIETSISDQSQKATIGEYLIKDSGVSPEVAEFAKAFAQKVKDGLSGTVISITSSGGNAFHNAPIATTLTATVFYGEVAITGQEALEQVYGEGAVLKWYDSAGSPVGTGFSLPVSSANDIAKYKVRLEA